MGVTRTAIPLAAAAAMGIVTLACNDGSAEPSGTPRPTLTLPPLPAEPVPTVLVDSAQVGQSLPNGLGPLTEDIIMSDPDVARLADGKAVFVESVGGWYWGPDPETGKDLIVATTANVKLGAPVSHESIELPAGGRRSDFYHRLPDDLQARYSYFRPGVTEWRLVDVDEFHVEVDFNAREVMDIYFLPSPNQTAEVLAPTFGPIDEDAIAGSLKESDAARRIVEDDVSLAAVLEEADSSYSSEYTVAGHRFGIVSARFDSGVTVAGDYPVIIDQDTTTFDYRSVVVPLNETSTRDLTVKVDLDREKIISVEPREGD